MRINSEGKITVKGCFLAFVAIYLVVSIPSWFFNSGSVVNSLEPQPLEVSSAPVESSAPVKSSTRPDVTIGMLQSSADSAVNQFMSQHGGSYNCAGFPEDPNYKICIYIGDENLEFHVEYGSVVKVF